MFCALIWMLKYRKPQCSLSKAEIILGNISYVQDFLNYYINYKSPKTIDSHILYVDYYILHIKLQQRSRVEKEKVTRKFETL